MSFYIYSSDGGLNTKNQCCYTSEDKTQNLILLWNKYFFYLHFFWEGGLVYVKNDEDYNLIKSVDRRKETVSAHRV